MNLILIDDRGGFWDGASRRVREAFGSPNSGDEFVEYAIRNIGFVAINTFSNQSAQVRFNPNRLSAATYDALGDWLRRHRVARVALMWPQGLQWGNELTNSAETLWRLDRMVKATRHAAPKAFLTRPARAADLPDANTLQTLLQHLPRALEDGHQAALLNLIRRCLGDRYVLVEGEPTLQKLVFREFGGSIYRQQLQWADKPIGKPVDLQPDLNYGRFVHASYEDALRLGRPRIEDVDAIVDWAAQGRTRLRYRRVIIPFRTTTGHARVLCGSIKDDRVDLRVG